MLEPLLVLHNDQAEVELGFSINKAMLESSMKWETVTSRKRVKDNVYAYKLELYQVRKYTYFADKAVYSKHINPYTYGSSDIMEYNSPKKTVVLTFTKIKLKDLYNFKCMTKYFRTSLTLEFRFRKVRKILVKIQEISGNFS